MGGWKGAGGDGGGARGVAGAVCWLDSKSSNNQKSENLSIF